MKTKTLTNGLLGRTGSLSGQAALSALRPVLVDGTIALSQLEDDGLPHLRGLALMTLSGGEIKTRQLLGRFAGLAGEDLGLHALPHSPNPVPLLPSAYPDAPLDALRALPRLVAGHPLPPGATQLSQLLHHMEASAWYGALVATGGDGMAVALLLRGVVAVAQVQRKGQALVEGLEALRSLSRLSQEEGGRLEMVPLDPTTAAAVAGYAQRRPRNVQDSQSSGLSVDGAGANLIHRGEVVLRVDGHPQRRGTFASATAEAAAPLRLPDETSGWEARRFALTLRGRDALNPMTDRWMRFQGLYGTVGVKLLAAIGDGASVEEVAITHGVEFEHLGGSLRKWVEEGLVRGV